MISGSIWSMQGRSAVLLLLVWSTWLNLVQAIFEDIGVTPINTAAIRLGEISFMQYVLGCIIFLQLVILYTKGVLPVEIDLSFDNPNGSLVGRARRPDATLATPTFLMECPLQYVCEVDAWANRDHDFFLEKLLASWFRNANHTWTHPEAVTFAGAGTCREMYPCPFDVQEVVGIRIPGSNSLASTQEETYSKFFTETIGMRQEPWL
ncbi:uncharacterized protein [Procambarus clarkii]|uniref:uncharacterized protein isoform X2 n=1 Tax=Procambarus clarkii TaxID=6728 RepID=UPI001E6702A2|nr:uncharacterized protein LOC123756464 isoform X2 [Procambarus clarkii]